MDALLATRGPKPVEPGPEAPRPVVDAWLANMAVWDQAGDELLQSAGVPPGTLHAERRRLEAEIKVVLKRHGLFDEGWPHADAEVRSAIASATGAEIGWVRRAWDAHRS